MTLKPPTRQTLVEQVVSQMKTLIKSGQWPIGCRIPTEPELVEQLGVSRNTIREAVRALVHSGLLFTHQGKGTFVRSNSELETAILRRVQRAEVLETLEVRYCLEREAGRLAALRRTDDDIGVMKKCLDEQALAIEKNDINRFLKYDSDLHHAIAKASQNRLIVDLYVHMSEALRNAIEYVQHEEDIAAVHFSTHQKLVEAIVEQNPSGAENATHNYLKAAQAVLLKK